MSETIIETTVPDVLKPVGPDYDADITYVREPKKAPPWLDPQPIPHDELPDDFDVDGSETIYGYPDAAGEILVDKILQLYDVDYDDIVTVNMWVGSKSGEEIDEGLRNGEIPERALLAEVETIIRTILQGRGIEWAHDVGDHTKTDDFIDGWMDAGHWGLERVFFTMDSDNKATVALALLELRDQFLDRVDTEWTPFEERDDLDY